jgi:hypothetical protein
MPYELEQMEELQRFVATLDNGKEYALVSKEA